MEISPKRLRAINAAIEKLKINTGLSYPENNLLEIAEALKLKVRELELPPFQGRRVRAFVKWFSDLEKTVHEGYDGDIGIHRELAPAVKNFVLAHQIGHFLLHAYEEVVGDPNVGDVWVDLEDYSTVEDLEEQRKESEADYFATTILIPKEKLVVRLREAKSLDEVAESFAIAKPVLESRMKLLGYKV
jgi:Zn-dependent peptidase ImmA (M78 family)